MTEEAFDAFGRQIGRRLDGEVVPLAATLKHEPLIASIPDESDALIGAQIIAVPTPEGFRIILRVLDGVPSSDETFVKLIL